MIQVDKGFSIIQRAVLKPFTGLLRASRGVQQPGFRSHLDKAYVMGSASSFTRLSPCSGHANRGLGLCFRGEPALREWDLLHSGIW